MAQNEDRGRYIKAGELAVVVGAGRSGKAAARLLLRQGARVRLLESNPQALDEAQAAALRAEGIELVLGEQGPELFAGAKMVVPSPGLPVVRLREMMGPMPMRKVPRSWPRWSWPGAPLTASPCWR